MTSRPRLHSFFAHFVILVSAVLVLLLATLVGRASADTTGVSQCPDGYQGVIVTVDNYQVFVCVKTPPPETP